MATHTEYAEGYELRCECGLYHSSTMRALACERCVEVLADHACRSVVDARTGKVVFSTREAKLARAKRDAERERVELEAIRSVGRAPLTFNPFAKLGR